MLEVRESGAGERSRHLSERWCSRNPPPGSAFHVCLCFPRMKIIGFGPFVTRFYCEHHRRTCERIFHHELSSAAAWDELQLAPLIAHGTNGSSFSVFQIPSRLIMPKRCWTDEEWRTVAKTVSGKQQKIYVCNTELINDSFQTAKRLSFCRIPTSVNVKSRIHFELLFRQRFRDSEKVLVVASVFKIEI